MLFLVHHGEAVDSAEDTRRPLSPSGRAHVWELARRARARAVRPDVIWHSGKLRARSTAEAFWQECNPLAEFSAARGLQPDDPPEWVRDVLGADEREILLVGHMPHLTRLLALLTGSSVESPFPPHGLVCLERDGRVWRERWREVGG